MLNVKNIGGTDMIKCKICKRRPNEIDEYLKLANMYCITPEKFIIDEEGTYNPKTKLFYCTDCYIKIGMPSGKA